MVWLSTEEILKALKLKYSSPQWATIEELRCGTGFNYKETSYNPQRSMDLFVINLYPSKNFHRICFEIKVSRSDFMNEIKKPEKKTTSLSLVNEFYFVTPKGLLKSEEIPEECGLIEVSPRDKKIGVVVPYLFKTIVKAPYRENKTIPIQFVASIARRAQKIEGESIE